MSKATPQFRRGTHPSWFGYHRATYVTVNIDRADEVWRRICRRRQIGTESEIKTVMGVGKTTAARYRRFFDALGLVEETRGHWFPGAGPDEWWAASIYMTSRDPDAFRAKMEGYSAAYVLSRRLRDTPEEEWRAIRFADGFRPTAVWVLRPDDGGGPGCLRETHFVPLTTNTDTPFVSKSVSVAKWWQEVETPPTVVLVERPTVVAPGQSREQSEHAITRLPASLNAPLVMKALGRSRATANRWLDKWVAEGRIVKVGTGRWAKVDP